MTTRIELSQRRGTTCAACGASTAVECGLPVDDAGDFVDNGYVGEWAGVPACRRCHDFHATHGAAALGGMVDALRTITDAARYVARYVDQTLRHVPADVRAALDTIAHDDT